MSPEVKLYKDLKKNTPNILWNRIENLSLLGMPDLLGYNKKQHFFTVELKVAKGVKTLDPSPSKTYSISLFRGSSIMTLVRDGVKTEPIACGFPACSSIFDEIGLTLENLGV
jgi:hypothetical protein